MLCTDGIVIAVALKIHKLGRKAEKIMKKFPAFRMISFDGKLSKIKKVKKNIEKKDKSVKGFNVGTNSGKVAGQSINHCHIHLIPRRINDVKNPQGGVRAVISSKQHYVRKK